MIFVTKYCDFAPGQGHVSQLNIVNSPPPPPPVRNFSLSLDFPRNAETLYSFIISMTRPLFTTYYCKTSIHLASKLEEEIISLASE
jgi:hypothetical protein